MNKKITSILAMSVMLTAISPARVRPQAEQTGDILSLSVETNELEITPEGANAYGPVTVEGIDLVCLGSYDSLLLSDEAGKTHEALSQAVEILNHEAAQAGEQALKDTWEGARRAVENGLAADRPGYEYGTVYYDGGSRIYVDRSDDMVLSFMRHDRWEDGGPYPSESRTGFCLDSRTGQVLTPAAVLTDAEGFRRLLSDRVTEHQGLADAQFFQDKLTEFVNGDPDSGISWTVGYEGVTVYFSSEVLPAEGTVTEIITYQEAPEMFRPEYTDHQTGYVSQLLLDSYFVQEARLDLKETGSPDTLLCTVSADEYGTLTALNLYYGEEAFTCPIYGYRAHARLVRTAEGKRYLYVTSDQDNDYRELTVISLSGEIRQAGNVQGEPVMMQDTSHFRMEDRTYLLSTLTADRWCQVSDNGLPEYTEPFWSYTTSHELTLREDLTLPQVDAAGEQTGSRTLEAGSVLRMLRTDRETFVDLQTDDDTIYRAVVDSDEWGWPQTVQGRDIEALFAGTFFAG